ncbi:MAG: FMN-binding protein [Candidatus Cloacimonetes bacterium]|nr:FMN-binding protein [Candidatus Cloacimonadota bacterium]
MSSRTALKEKRLYPVLFMLILSIILTSILALFFELSKERVAAYQELSFRRDLIGLFQKQISGIDNSNLAMMDIKQINSIYESAVTELHIAPKQEIIYYQVKDGNQLIGFCYPFSMSGLWGTISLLAAVDVDFSTIMGIRITNQNETPGLGGRISEDWFQQQFAGHRFRAGNEFLTWELIPEKSVPQKEAIRQITGATISSRSVTDGLLMRLKQIYQLQVPAGSDK